ncbi:MAG: hypothetical protein H0W42_03085 [Gemmatimonadaceae bacterium]|nr:hypothetical protein [Gemmatimonadaceae bacterium]
MQFFRSSRFHFWATVAWGVGGAAFTVYYAADASTMEVFIAAISVYANMATHWGAMQGARAEEVSAKPAARRRREKPAPPTPKPA